jgi:hypothetical protein
MTILLLLKPNPICRIHDVQVGEHDLVLLDEQFSLYGSTSMALDRALLSSTLRALF